MLHRLLSLSITLTISTLSFSQKKPLDHTVYDAWESVTTMQVSPSGDVITWIVAPQEGDATLYIKTLGKKGRELNIPRGASPVILEDGSTLICNIRPFFADTRQARIKKKKADDMPRDTVAIIDLKTGGITKFPHIKSIKTARFGSDAIAFSSADTSLVPKKERKKKDNGSPVLVYHIKTGKTDTLRHIDTFTFDRSGRTLAFIEKKGKHSTQVGYFDVTTSTTTMLPDTSAYHSLPVFDRNGTKAAFLQAPDTLDGSKHCGIWEITIGADKPRLVVSPDSREGFPAGYGITENSRLSYSHDGTRLFSGIQEFIAPKDTSLVPFETAGLDIWNWDSPELPPMTKINLKRDLTRTLKAVVDGNRLIPMTTSRYDRLYNVNRGDASWLLSEDLTASIVSTQWDSQPVSTLSMVNISDGSRTKIAEGRYENVTPSPLGSYILYFDLKQRNWLIFNTNTKSTSNITSTLPVNFWDEDNDRPMLSTPYGIADWAADDSFVLLCDRYDIWRIDLPSGNASCLTQGRTKGLTYRYLQTRDEETIGLTPNSTIYLSIFDNSTKENGLASLNLAKPSALSHIALGPNSYTGFAKARDRDTFIYRKGSFAEPMDIYYTTRPGREEIRLSSINPQQKEYNWMTAELYHWTAYDGTRLDGILCKPEDFDPSRKYPVMIYFYEKNSETLYRYRPVAPSASTVNIPFYASRGYVVFIPDIVYNNGTPGECAYNCIVSGAESLRQFDWIDGDNMAIQGQSWGGYQVAYLITRTGMFKAAGAGAPVANMTSAYGGIRWASGMSRQFQYEQTQSRIGRDLWHGIGLYMDNSPLFGLPEVTTPVLIMHNDNDGAVPWYQGIEMFMGLRRLGKPAWLLEYNGEEHNLMERRNRKDLSRRLQQFFDHYLQGAPEPAWMRTGIPTSRKGQYFGFEPAE